MMRGAVTAALLALGLLGNAPLQCGHGGDSELRHEDDPGDALWTLAMDFRAKGNEAAARETLRFLVERYPSNRHARAAREDLATAGGDAGSR
jgi:hypothetical protein